MNFPVNLPTKKGPTIPPHFQQVVEELNAAELNDESEFNVLSRQGNLRVLQHRSKPQILKAMLLLRFDPERVFHVIADPDAVARWNSSIVEARVVNFMKKDNTAII